MKDRSLVKNIKLIGNLRFQSSSAYWLVQMLFDNIWKHVATIRKAKKESNKKLFERALGQIWTLAEAEEKTEQFFSAFPELKSWGNRWKI